MVVLGNTHVGACMGHVESICDIGETCHWDCDPTLFEEWQGVFYVQCPLDRAPHTMVFDNSVMVTPRGNVQ